MATGAHDFVRPPPPSTPHSSSIRFPRGLAGRSVETRAGSTCDACDGAAELFKPGPHAGADGEEAWDGENCAGVPAVGAGGNRYNVQRNAAAFGGRRRVGIGTYTTLAPLDEPKRWQLGPTILFDRPRPAPPTPPPSDFPVGLAGRPRTMSSEPRRQDVCFLRRQRLSIDFKVHKYGSPFP